MLIVIQKIHGAQFISRAIKVCSVNFEPPTESPWMNAVPAQLWLFLVKMTSSWHDLIKKLVQDCPIGKRQCLIREICYFQIINIKQGEGGSDCEMSEITWQVFISKVEQSSFTLIALFWLEIGRCRGRKWLNGNQALPDGSHPQ